MSNVAQLCLVANIILLMRKWNHAFLFLAIVLAWKWQIASQIIKKQTRWSDDKTIIELRYRKNILIWQWEPDIYSCIVPKGIV